MNDPYKTPETQSAAKKTQTSKATYITCLVLLLLAGMLLFCTISMFMIADENSSPNETPIKTKPISPSAAFLQTPEI